MRLLTNKMIHFFSVYLKLNIHVSVCLIFYSLTISLKNDLILTSNHILLMFLFVFGAYNFIRFNENKFSSQNKQSSNKLIFFYLFAFIFLSRYFLFFWINRTNNIPRFKPCYSTLFSSSFWKTLHEKKYSI